MASAINLVTKYSKDIDNKFSIESVIGNNYSNKFSFVGARTIKIFTPETVDLNTYGRPTTTNTATNTLARFGSYKDVETTIQELQMSQDKSFAMTVDTANEEETDKVITAMKWLGAEIKEKVTPTMDKYTLDAWAKGHGLTSGNAVQTASGTLTAKNALIDALFEASSALTNELVPLNDRIVYVKESLRKDLMRNDYVIHYDAIGGKAYEKGLVGTIDGMKIICVPDSYMPYMAASNAKQVNFIATYKDAVIRPVKIKQTRILSEVAGIDGDVLEGRFYYDAFVLDAKCKGVYVHHLAS